METDKKPEKRASGTSAAEKLAVDTEVEISGPGVWFVIHSTSLAWHEKRNVRLTIPNDDGDATYTYQEPKGSAIHKEVVKSSGWKGLCRGRVGKLESWMRETAYGIEDTSGRSSVVNFQPLK
jgi:hypothetical protein